MNRLRFQLQIVGLVVLLALAVDAFISVATTCQDLGLHGSNEPDAARYCSVFHGPVLAALRSCAAFFAEPREAVVAAFTVVLAISPIGLWWTTLALWEVGEAQLRYMGETAEGRAADMKASVAAAQQSAEAAKKSAEVAAASV